MSTVFDFSGPGALWGAGTRALLYSHSHGNAVYAVDPAFEEDNGGGERGVLEKVALTRRKGREEGEGEEGDGGGKASSISLSHHLGSDMNSYDDFGGDAPGLEGGGFDEDVRGSGIGETGDVSWKETGETEEGGAEKSEEEEEKEENATLGSSSKKSTATVGHTKGNPDVGVDKGPPETTTSSSESPAAYDALTSAEVSFEKWHPDTVATLRHLCMQMTAPLGGKGKKQSGAGSKKRGSGEISLLSAEDGGDLGVLDCGQGSSSSPLIFSQITSGASKNFSALTFLQILVLRSWDIIITAQDSAGGDIFISRSSRFSEAWSHHM